jgi:hypothetical protein
MKSSNEEYLTGCGAIMILLFVCISIFLTMTGNYIQTTSQGSQFGEVVSIDKTKAWVVFGDKYNVYVKSDSQNSETIEFCMDSSNIDLFQNAKEYSRSGEKVEIIYESYLLTRYDLCQWQITDIKPII